MTIPFAHETWFDHGAYPTDWGFAAEKLTLSLLAVAVIVTLFVRLVGRIWPGADLPFLGRLVPFIPFAIRLHLAVSLVGLLSLGFYLSPAMDLQADASGVLLGATMAVVAYGSHPQLRPAVSALLPPGLSLRRCPIPAVAAEAAA